MLRAIGLSLTTTIVSTLLIILGGTPLAYAHARRQFRFGRLIDRLIVLPLVLPLAIYIGFELDLDIALTLSVILILFSFLALLIAKGILHRDWMVTG